jgi:hypothetical protein
VHTCREGAGNAHMAKGCTHARLHNEMARNNVGMHERRASIEVTKACTHGSNKKASIEVTNDKNAHSRTYRRRRSRTYAKRQTYASKHDERARNDVVMHDGRARI